MRTLFVLAYIVTGFYSVAVFCSVVKFAIYRWGKPDIRDATWYHPKYTAVLVTASLLLVMFHWYRLFYAHIPEDTRYTIRAELTVEKDKKAYIVPLEVEYTVDVEVDDNEEPDYITGRNVIPSTQRHKYFTVYDYSDPQVQIDNFEPEYLELPETVQSGSTYEVSIWGYTVEDYERDGTPVWSSRSLDANLSIPYLTQASLGLTADDILRSIGVGSYIEHILIFISSATCLFLCLTKKEVTAPTEPV